MALLNLAFILVLCHLSASSRMSSSVVSLANLLVNPLSSNSPQILSGVGLRNVTGPFKIHFAECLLPISGQYGILPRILFYLLLIFSLVVRSHEWLAAGALVASMTYSGSAAIHVILAPLYSRTSAGDDVFPVAAILSTSCIIAVPLFNWSSTLRQLQARPLIIYWNILVVIGFISLSISIHNRERYPGILPVEQPETFSIECGFDPNGFVSLPLLLDAQWLTAHHCTNPCNLMSINVPFRAGDSVSALSMRTGPEWFAAVPLLNNFFDFGFLPMLILQGFHACFAQRSSPAETRNWLFLALCYQKGKRNPNRLVQTGAKYTATLFYVTTMAMLMTSPPLFVTNVILRELNLAQSAFLQENESPTMVGQWSPWVGAILALLGAVIVRYHESWTSVLYACFEYRTRQDNMLSRQPEQSTNVAASTLYQDPQIYTNIDSTSNLLRSSHPQLYLNDPSRRYDQRMHLWHPRWPRDLVEIISSRRKEFQYLLLSPVHTTSHYLQGEWQDFTAWLADPFNAPRELESFGAKERADGQSILG